MRLRKACFLTMGALGVLVGFALGDGTMDWPQFRGPRRDGIAGSGLALLRQWPEGGPEALWVYTGLGEGFASTSIANGRIYTTGLDGNQGFVHALDLDGTLLWKVSYGPDWNRSYSGSRTTPTVADGRLYVYSAQGRAVCLDAATGRELWAVDTVAEFGARNITWGLTESPLVLDGMVIFSPGGPQAGVVALDAETGQTRWVCADVRDLSGYCSPMVVERGGRTIIAQLMATTFVGIDAADGSLLWREVRDPAPNYGIQAVSPVYADGIIYVTSGYGGPKGRQYLLSEDGTRVTPGWQDAELDCQLGGLILHHGRIYGASDRNNRNQWLILSLETGEVLARTRGVGKGALIMADGLLYTYGERGVMGLLNPDPEDFRLISSFNVQAGSGQHWAHPAIADGRLYLRRGDALMAFDIRAKE